MEGNRGGPLVVSCLPAQGPAEGIPMTSTAILTDDTATIVAEEENPFRWGVVIAGAFAATATTFFLLTLGAAIGLALMPAAHATDRLLQSGRDLFPGLPGLWLRCGRLSGGTADRAGRGEHRRRGIPRRRAWLCDVGAGRGGRCAVDCRRVGRDGIIDGERHRPAFRRSGRRHFLLGGHDVRSRSQYAADDGRQRRSAPHPRHERAGAG